MWSKAGEVGRVPRPLQNDRQLLNALCKRLWRLQLEQRIEEESESKKIKNKKNVFFLCFCSLEACYAHLCEISKVSSSVMNDETGAYQLY